MDEIEKLFRSETGTIKPFSNGFENTIYLQKYIKWLVLENKRLSEIVNSPSGGYQPIGTSEKDSIPPGDD